MLVLALVVGGRTYRKLVPATNKMVAGVVGSSLPITLLLTIIGLGLAAEMDFVPLSGS